VMQQRKIGLTTQSEVVASMCCDRNITVISIPLF
jgi:hypothetical protein